MTKNLQFRSKAMAFASYSSGNEPFNVDKRLVTTSKKRPFENQTKKLMANESNDMCTSVGGTTHVSLDPVQP